MIAHFLSPGDQKTKSKPAVKQSNDPFSQNADDRLPIKWWTDAANEGMDVKTG